MDGNNVPLERIYIKTIRVETFGVEYEPQKLKKDEVDKKEEYAIDAEFADKAAKLMNEHTHAVIDMLKGSWKKDAKGWYFKDASGWYAKKETVTINGKDYNFNAEGYCTNP